MDNHRATTPSPVVLPFWGEGDVETRGDGFLYLTKYNPQTTAAGVEEEEPLLLQSSEALLKALYPSCHSKKELLEQVGHIPPVPFDDTTIEESEKEVSKQQYSYEPYQHLVRAQDIMNRIQAALNDIPKFRNRAEKKINSESETPGRNAKVVALERQQNRLLLSQQSRQSEDDGSVDNMDIDSDDNENDEANHGSNEEEDGEHDEAALNRLVRTFNSIRAVFPHIIPILTHPLCDDQQLVLGETKYVQRNKRKPMTWLLGTEVFDTTTKKQRWNARNEAKRILQGFIETKVASNLVDDDSSASSSYWCRQWISDVTLKHTVRVKHPREILASNQGESKDILISNAKMCDEKFIQRSTEESPGTHERYLNAINALHNRLSTVLKNRFSGARLSIYGSCLSDLSLGKHSDVDISLWLPEGQSLKDSFERGEIEASKYEKKMKSLVYEVSRRIGKFSKEFRSLQPIPRARVPVIQGVYFGGHNPHEDDGSIHFDICFLNDIAVANSSLLREYSLVDSRVKDLMLSVKRWSKENNISSAKDNTISSYAWINLVIFYLQCLGFVPNLQSKELMAACGVTPDREEYWHTVNKLDTCTLKLSEVTSAGCWNLPDHFHDISVTELLYGFFEFYTSSFLSSFYAVSMKRGDMSLSKLTCRKTTAFLCIEDPFETFDSYCPHDLGAPASEGGRELIMKCFHASEAHLRSMLGGAEAPTSIWPVPEPRKEKTKNNNSKRDNKATKASRKRTENDEPKKKMEVEQNGGPKNQAPNLNQRNNQKDVNGKNTNGSPNEATEGNKSRKKKNKKKKKKNQQQQQQQQQQQNILTISETETKEDQPSQAPPEPSPHDLDQESMKKVRAESSNTSTNDPREEETRKKGRRGRGGGRGRGRSKGRGGGRGRGRGKEGANKGNQSQKTEKHLDN